MKKLLTVIFFIIVLCSNVFADDPNVVDPGRLENQNNEQSIKRKGIELETKASKTLKNIEGQLEQIREIKALPEWKEMSQEKQQEILEMEKLLIGLREQVLLSMKKGKDQEKKLLENEKDKLKAQANFKQATLKMFFILGVIEGKEAGSFDRAMENKPQPMKSYFQFPKLKMQLEKGKLRVEMENSSLFNFYVKEIETELDIEYEKGFFNGYKWEYERVDKLLREEESRGR